MGIKPELRREFERIYKDTCRSIYRQAVRGARSLHDAEDVFQETYVELLSELEKGTEIRSPESFTATILRRRLSAYYERLGRSSLIDYISVEDISPEPIEDLDIEESLITEAFCEEIKARLRARDEQTVQIFYMYYTLGMPLGEISDSLGVSVSNVKNKLYRTLKELREFYAKGDHR